MRSNLELVPLDLTYGSSIFQVPTVPNWNGEGFEQIQVTVAESFHLHCIASPQAG